MLGLYLCPISFTRGLHPLRPCQLISRPSAFRKSDTAQKCRLWGRLETDSLGGGWRGVSSLRYCNLRIGILKIKHLAKCNFLLLGASAPPDFWISRPGGSRCIYEYINVCTSMGNPYIMHASLPQLHHPHQRLGFGVTLLGSGRVSMLDAKIYGCIGDLWICGYMEIWTH
jgi:hypothetical protein